MADPRLARPSWRGRTNVDAMTIAAIERAEKIGGHQFVVTQGSYQGGHGDRNSAGTHDGGGVVDLRWCGHARCIRALRQAGFAAWLRTPAQGPWPHHIHAVLGGHPRLAQSAANQWTAYVGGRDGLKSNGPDDGPRINPIPRFTWSQEDDMALDKDDIDKVTRSVVNALMQRNLTGKKGELTVATALRRAANAPELIRGLPAAIEKALPEPTTGGGLTRAQVRQAAEAAVRSVLGSLDEEK